MNSFFNKAALCALVVIPLAGCSTSGTSTHGSIDNSYTHSVREDRDDQTVYSTVNPAFPPRSDNVSLKGDKSKNLLVQGQDHFADQNFGLAEESFRQAVEVRADNANAWMGLAASLDQLGRFEFADRAYEQLRSLKGDDPKILNNMGYSYLLRGEYKKARRMFRKAQTADPLLEEVQGNIHLLEKIIAS